MAHNHAHKHTADTSNLKVAFFLNLSFTIIEIVGGILTNSVAIVSDSIHDLGDTLSLGVAWYLQKVSKKERDNRYSYGYRRYSVLGALITGIVLLAGCILIVSEAIPRLMHPEDVDPVGMIILSVIGIVVNSLAVLRLRKGSSINEKVVSLHLLEDVLGWIAVLIGSIAILLWNIRIIDAILSLGIAVYILINLYRNLKSALEVILQRIPKNVDINSISEFLQKNKLIDKAYDIHIWSLDGDFNIMTVNIKVDPKLGMATILELKQELHEQLKEYNIDHATIEIK